MDRPSHAWRQQGNIAIWRYTENTRNYPGWHLTVDAPGAQSASVLVASLHADSPGSSRTVAVRAPSAAELRVPNNRTAGIVAPEKLRLTSHPDSGHWHFEEVSGTLAFSFGAAWVEPLRAAIGGIAHGEGDFSIGPPAREQRLWFWWQPAI
jgi:hypothetical protein